ncbi:hypothetical protein [Leptospira meyeri]|uniref:hypothetical protein n=1 Tax=Leptospira meyeri TaxID=29508 RepID=UPI00143827B2|nr:hypothetical protein [Leptospira meyeri]
MSRFAIISMLLFRHPARKTNLRKDGKFSLYSEAEGRALHSVAIRMCSGLFF